MQVSNKFISLNRNQVDKALIDILLLTYNQEQYIRAALDGISIQMLDEMVSVRIIVADDCSEDNTYEIIKEYKNKIRCEWIYLPNDIHLGIAGNYKRAIREVRGDYVAILEGDDYWTDKYRLQKHFDYLSTHLDCVMTCNNLLEYSQEKREWRLEKSSSRYLFLREMINEYTLANLSARVFKGSVLRGVDDCVYDYGEKQRNEATDYYLTMYVLQYGYGYVLDDVMSVYRIDTGSNISRRDLSYDEFVDRGRVCSSQMTEMLGESYSRECKRRYDDAVNVVKRELNIEKYNKLSEYIPPIAVRVMLSVFPSLLQAIKQIIRQFIPNKLHRFLRRYK